MGDSAIRFRVSPGWPTGLLATFLVLCNGFASNAADAEENSSPTSLFGSKYTIALGGFFPKIDAHSR